MKILFWNVWCFPKWITGSDLTDVERAHKIVPIIENYDIVLLCEAWTAASKEIGDFQLIWVTLKVTQNH